jgi:hypothetical protein
MHRILAEKSVNITELRKNPAKYFIDQPVAVLSNNRPAGYLLSASASVCPVIIILLSSESNTGASSTSKVLKNGIICALPRSNILRFWSSLISTRNPWGTISISRFASICASRAMVLILVASSPSSVADFFFSSAVFSLTSRAFFSVSSGTATVAGFDG